MQPEPQDPRTLSVEVVKHWQYRGFICFVKTHPFGHYMGYAHHEMITDIQPHRIHDEIQVHGGVTYRHNATIGFDCAHHTDVCLDDDGNRWGIWETFPPVLQSEKTHTWCVEDVAAECEHLVDQLIEICGPPKE